MDRLIRRVNIFRANRDAEDVDAVGETPKSESSVKAGTAILFAITAIYLYYEINWQMNLLHIMSSAKSTRDELDWVVLEGRALAAFGLVWAILKTKFLKSSSEVGSMIVTGLLVAGVTVLAFSSIGRLYDSAIDSLPAETSLQMYKVSAHRVWSLQGDLPPDASSKDPVAVMLWPLKMADKAQAPGIEAVFDKRAEGFKASAEDQARKMWPEVQGRLERMNGRGQGEISSTFQEAYLKYISGSKETVSSIGSWQAKRTEYFKSLTGMDPNPNASKEDFARALTTAKINQYRELGTMYLETQGFTSDPVVHQAGDLIFHASDLAKIRTEDQFIAMVTKKASGGMAALVPTLQTVKTLPQANEVVSSAVVPPISMALSTISILLNAGSLVGLLCIRLPVLRYIQTLIPIVFAAGVLMMVPPTTSLPGLGTGMAWLHSNYSAVSWLLERVVTLEHLALAIL